MYLSMLLVVRKILLNKYDNEFYKFTISYPNEHEYILKATPIGKQARFDAICGALIVDYMGHKSISGGGDVRHCWP